MKNILWFFAGLAVVVSLCVMGFGADTSRIGYGSLYDSTADNYAVNPDSFTVTTISGTLDGTERFIQNRGPDSIFITKDTTSGVQSRGIELSSGTIYVEDQWMGAMYLQVEAGGDPCNVRIENKKIQ